MSNLDYDAARQYALFLLRQLSDELPYHSIQHTHDDVLPAVTRLAERSGVNGKQATLLRTAALFHDVGFIKQVKGHEQVSATIAATQLPKFGYDAASIGAIWQMILATCLPQSPITLLDRLLCDADLDVLGRDDFLECNVRLYQEAVSQRPIAVRDWLLGQIKFVSLHRYHSAAARDLRDAGKRHNLQRLWELFDSPERYNALYQQNTTL